MAFHFLFNAHFHRGEIDEFEVAGERAVALNPNHADKLADYGVMLCCIGDWDRGINLASKAIKLSPIHPGWFHVAPCLNHYRRGDYKLALAAAQRIQMPAFYWSYVPLAVCNGQLDRAPEAGAACEKLIDLVPDFAEQAWDHLAAWNMSEDLMLQIVGGLRKAGLRIPDQAGDEKTE